MDVYEACACCGALLSPDEVEWGYCWSCGNDLEIDDVEEEPWWEIELYDDEDYE